MLFIFVGLLVGALGTLVGVGGGFLLVPFLLFYDSSLDSSTVVAMGLFCVAVNGFAASIHNYFKENIHLKLASIFALFSLPAAWLSAKLVQGVERKNFELIFATLMFVIGVFFGFQKTFGI